MEDEDYDSDTSDSTVLLTEYFDEPEKIDAKRRRLSNLHDKIHADKYEDDEENTASDGASDDSRTKDKHKQKNNVDKTLLITKYLAGIGEVKIENNEPQTFPVTTKGTKQIKNLLDSNNGRNPMTNAVNTEFDDEIICLDSDDEVHIDDENEKNQNENLNNAVHKVYGDNNNLTENNDKYGKLKVLKPAAINARRSTINNSVDSYRLDKNKTDTIEVMRPSVITARRATTSLEENCNSINEKTNEAIALNTIDNTNMRNKIITFESCNTASTSSAISVDTKNLKSNSNKRIRNEDKIPSESKRLRTETMSKCIQHHQLKKNTHNNEIASCKLTINPDKNEMDETIDNKENEHLNNTHSEQEKIDAKESSYEVTTESRVGCKSKALGMVDKPEPKMRSVVQGEEQASEACDLPGTNKVQEQDKISTILIKPKMSTTPNEQVTNESHQKHNKTDEQGEQKTNVLSDEQEISRALNEEEINESHNKKKNSELQDTQEISVVPGEQVMNESHQKRKKTEIQDVQEIYKARYEEVINESHDEHQKTKVQSDQEMHIIQDEQEICRIRNEEVVNELHDKQEKFEVQDKQETNVVPGEQETCRAREEEVINKSHNKDKNPVLQDKQEISVVPDEQCIGKVRNERVINEPHQKQKLTEIQGEPEMCKARYEAHDKHKKTKVQSDQGMRTTQDELETCSVRKEETINESHDTQKKTKLQGKQEKTTLQDDHEIYKGNNQQEINECHDKPDKSKVWKKEISPTQNQNVIRGKSDKQRTSKIPKDQIINEASDNQKTSVVQDDNISRILDMPGTGYAQDKEVISDDKLKAVNQVQHIQRTTKVHNQQETKKPNDEEKANEAINESGKNERNEINREVCSDKDKIHIQNFHVIFFTKFKNFIEKKGYLESAMVLHNLIQTLQTHAINGIVVTDIKYTCPKCKHVTTYLSSFLNNTDSEENIATEDDFQKCRLCQVLTILHKSYMKKFLKQVPDDTAQNKVKNNVATSYPPLCNDNSSIGAVNSNRPTTNNPEIIAKVSKEADTEMPLCKDTSSQNMNVLKECVLPKHSHVNVETLPNNDPVITKKRVSNEFMIDSKRKKLNAEHNDAQNLMDCENTPDEQTNNLQTKTTNNINILDSGIKSKSNLIAVAIAEECIEKENQKTSEKASSTLTNEDMETYKPGDNTLDNGPSARSENEDMETTNSKENDKCNETTLKSLEDTFTKLKHNKNTVQTKNKKAKEQQDTNTLKPHVNKYHPEKFRQNVVTNENNDINEDGSVKFKNDMSKTSDLSRYKYRCSICEEILSTDYACRQHRKHRHPDCTNLPIYEKVIIKDRDEDKIDDDDIEQLDEENVQDTSDEGEVGTSVKEVTRQDSTHYKQTRGKEERSRNDANYSEINETITEASKYKFHCRVCDEILNNDYASRQHRKQKHPELKRRKIYKKVILKGNEEQDGGDCSSSDDSDLDDNEESASDANDEENEDSDDSDYVDETDNDNSVLNNTKSVKYACALCKERFPSYYVARKHRTDKHPNMKGAHLIIKIPDDATTNNEQSSNKNAKHQSPSQSSSSSDNEESEDNNDKNVSPRYYEEEGNSGDKAIKASDHSNKKRDPNVIFYANENETSARAKINETISTQEPRREQSDDQLRTEHKEIEKINANNANNSSEIEDAHASEEESLKISEHTAKKKKERNSNLFKDDNDDEQPNKTDCDQEIITNNTRNTTNLKPTDDVSKTKDVDFSEERENNEEKCGTGTSCRENAKETCINKNDRYCNLVTEASELAINGKNKIDELNNAETKVRDDDRTEIDMIDCFLEELNSEPPAIIQNENSGDNNNKNPAVTASQISDGEIQTNEEYQYHAANLSVIVHEETCLDNIKITNVTSIAEKLYIYVCQECLYATDDYDIVIRHCQNHYNNIEDPLLYCQICQINYDVPCFQRHERSHDKYLKSVKIYYSYKWLFANWQRVFENNEMLLTDAEDMQVKSIYKTFCVRMLVEQDGPWQTSLYLCRKCNTCVPPQDIESHVQQTCQFIHGNCCSVCKYAFLTDDMRIHHEIYHKNDASELFKIVVFNDKDDESFNLKLFQAKAILKNKGNLRVTDIFKCLCGLCFISLKNLKLHFVKCEELTSNGIDCPECTVLRRFLPGELTSHRSLHHGTANYEFKVQQIGFQEETNNNSEAVCTPDAENDNGPTAETEDFEVDMLKDETLTQISNENESLHYSEPVECIEENLTDKRDSSKDELLTQNSNDNNAQGYPDNVELNEEDLAVKGVMLKDETLTQISNEGSQRQPESVECIEENLTDKRDMSKDESLRQNSNDNDGQGYPENVEINEEDVAVKREMLKNETLTQTTNKDSEQSDSESVRNNEENSAFETDILNDDQLTQTTNKVVEESVSETVQLSDESLAVEIQTLNELVRNTDDGYNQTNAESVEFDEENAAKRNKFKDESLKQVRNEGDTELIELSDNEDDVNEKVGSQDIMDVDSEPPIAIDSDSDSDIEFVF